MATNCEELLAADILKNCDEAPVAGLEVNILLFNKLQIDYSSITYSGTNDLLVTNFQLLSGNTGYLLEGVKQSNSVSSELVIKDFGNAYKHLVAGAILEPSVENMKSLENIMSGGDFVAIVERKWKGVDDADAFIILGLDSGLTASSSTWNSKENDGVELFEIASADGYEEPKKPRVLLETDYATTLVAFAAKFVQP